MTGTRPPASPALAVASLALIVSLAGTGFALGAPARETVATAYCGVVDGANFTYQNVDKEWVTDLLPAGVDRLGREF